MAVWPLQRPYALPVARQALADEGIALHARSRAQRAMLQWLAPYIPIDLLVPAADAERARELLQWQPKVGLDEGLAKTIAYFDGLLSEQ